MDLLEERLPDLRLTIDIAPSVFFDRCEAIAHTHSWAIDRRREYAGPGYNQLNLQLGTGDSGSPMLRMVATPEEAQRLRLDVVGEWVSSPVGYDEYVGVARAAYAQLFADYVVAHGKRLRLGLPRRPPRLDSGALDCNRIRYAAEKLGGLCRTLAIGKGDARDRLISGFATFHVIRPADLPPPLRAHLQWVYDQVTSKPARHRWEGSLEASVRTMKNVTAARVLERLIDIADAVETLEAICDRRRAAGS